MTVDQLIDAVYRHAAHEWTGFRETLLHVSMNLGLFIQSGELTKEEATSRLLSTISSAGHCPNVDDKRWIAQGLDDGLETMIDAQDGYLDKLAREVYEWAHSKGSEPAPHRTFGDEIALLHSECSEALEAYRQWKFEDLTESDGKPEGVGSEFADILIRLLHYSYVHDIDLQAEYTRKMTYNRTRSWQHGGKSL